MIGVMTLMLTFVIPQMAPILEDSGQELPIYTKAVLWLSSFVTDYGLIALVVFVVGVFLHDMLAVLVRPRLISLDSMFHIWVICIKIISFTNCG